MKLKSLLTIALLSLSFASIEAAESKKHFVETLLTPYLQIQTGLAGDDLEGAKQGAQAYITAFKQGSPSLDHEKLTRYALEIENASEISAARNSFSGLSAQTLSLVQYSGPGENNTLFIAECPMAFDGKGGVWLQASETIANPYYGSAMLTCGSIKTKLDSVGSQDLHTTFKKAQPKKESQTCPSDEGKAGHAKDACCEKEATLN